MKFTSSFFSAILIATGFLAGCDTIDNPIPKTFDQLTVAEGRALDSLETKHGINAPVQKVLLEDYTGHQCGNCPGAAVAARSLQAQYGDRLVVMAVHAGYFAKSDKAPFTTDFTTPAGEEWATTFGVISNPNGMINRVPKANSTSAVQGIATWPAAVAVQMAKAPQIGLTLTTNYTPETRDVLIKVRSEYRNAIPGNLNLAVFITEDSIVNWQKNYGAAAGGDPNYPVGEVQNYVHPHALRLAVNGTWGRLNKADPKAGDVTEAYFKAPLDASWRAKKCSVIAIIFDANTKEVLQVQESHLD